MTVAAPAAPEPIPSITPKPPAPKFVALPSRLMDMLAALLNVVPAGMGCAAELTVSLRQAGKLDMLVKAEDGTYSKPTE